jgi:uncharacterized protein DUF4157/lysine-specific metallo-endopeptidase family protein
MRAALTGEQCRCAGVQRFARGRGSSCAPSVVHEALRSSDKPLDPPLRTDMEARFGHDFSRVRIHTDAGAAESARAVSAEAYTVGRDVVFDSGRYAPHTDEGRGLLAHELAHVVQQSTSPIAPGGTLEIGSPADAEERDAQRAAEHASSPTTSTNGAVLRREPVFPDTTCEGVQANITRAWPTAKRWAQNASSRLATPSRVSDQLGEHFKLDPSDAAQAADLAYVQRVFNRIVEIFDIQIPNRCMPPDEDEYCTHGDGRAYAAYTEDQGRPESGIVFCTSYADVGLLLGQDLIKTLVHEVSHLADAESADFAYRKNAAAYGRMPRAQAIVNGDSYSEFARDLYAGTPRATPLVLGLGTGALLTAQRPLWVITGSLDVRSRSGIEVFDLVGGLHGWIDAKEGTSGKPDFSRAAGGLALDIGLISRSADTGFFVDTRVGAFAGIDPRAPHPGSAGLSARTLMGWARSGFRVGVDTRVLADFLNDNNGMIIGVEVGYSP